MHVQGDKAKCIRRRKARYTNARDSHAHSSRCTQGCPDPGKIMAEAPPLQRTWRRRRLAAAAQDRCLPVWLLVPLHAGPFLAVSQLCDSRSMSGGSSRCLKQAESAEASGASGIATGCGWTQHLSQRTQRMLIGWADGRHCALTPVAAGNRNTDEHVADRMLRMRVARKQLSAALVTSTQKVQLLRPQQALCLGRGSVRTAHRGFSAAVHDH